MRHDTSQALYDYWLSCRREANVRATQIRAAELAAILPSIFLIDLGAASEAGFRVRFCGAAIASRYGRDLTDESFLALWPGPDAAMLRRDIGATAFRSTGVVLGVMTETVGGGSISYEMLLLPLSGDDGAAGAIGSMARIAGHEETNRIRARVVGQSLRSIRFLPTRRIGLDRDEFAIPSALSAAGARRRYGHLTVLTGGK